MYYSFDLSAVLDFIAHGRSYLSDVRGAWAAVLSCKGSKCKDPVRSGGQVEFEHRDMKWLKWSWMLYWSYLNVCFYTQQNHSQYFSISRDSLLDNWSARLRSQWTPRSRARIVEASSFDPHLKPLIAGGSTTLDPLHTWMLQFNVSQVWIK